MKILNESINLLREEIIAANENIAEILIMLFFVLIMSFYVYFVYHLVSRKTLYNKSFHISMLLIPFFIASIIKALNSNTIITLGTVGALAIIRFRTAVKDPLDMIFVLWCIFVGISCGSRLYLLGILTSIVVTIVIICGRLLREIFNKTFCLVVNCSRNAEIELVETLKKFAKVYRIKSRNITLDGIDYIIEINTKLPNELLAFLEKCEYIKQASLIEFDTDDFI